MSGFPRVVSRSIHTEVLEVQEVCQNWEEFEGRLLERYGYDHSVRRSKRKFMDWVESSEKERNTSALLQEVERRFARLSALDRTVLDTSRVLLFVKSVNALNRGSVGPLLETDEGLTTDWAIVKRVYSRFDKRREWSDKGLEAAGATAGKRIEEPTPARTEVTRMWFEDGEVPKDVVKGSSGDAALDELTKMIREL